MDISSLFGGGAPSLQGLQAGPGFNLNQGLQSPIGMTASTPMLGVPQGMDLQKMLAMLQQQNMSHNQPQAQAQFIPGPAIQAGGGAFSRPYEQAGLLGGIYGTV